MRSNATPWNVRLSARLLAAAIALSVAPAWPTLPVARLFSVFPTGGKQGTTVDVTITGTDLEGVSKLHFSTPGITAVQKTRAAGAGPERAARRAGAVHRHDSRRRQAGHLRAASHRQVWRLEPAVVRRRHAERNHRNRAQQHARQGHRSAPGHGRQRPVERRHGPGLFQVQRQARPAGDRRLLGLSHRLADGRLAGALRRDAARSWSATATRTAATRCWISSCRPTARTTSKCTISSTQGEQRVLLPHHRSAPTRISISSSRPSGLPGSKGSYTLYGRNLPGGQPTEVVAADGKPLESLAVADRAAGRPERGEPRHRLDRRARRVGHRRLRLSPDYAQRPDQFGAYRIRHGAGRGRARAERRSGPRHRP